MTTTPTPIEEQPQVLAAIQTALKEDGVARDVTTLSLVDPDVAATADVIARHPCRVAGTTVGATVFKLVDPSLEIELRVRDGDDVAANDVLLTVRGCAGSILGAERTALNFMQRMTGIATATRSFTAAVAGTKCTILDTRKTAPGLRLIDKHAVKAGGGANHRMGLHDMVLIKDNHRKLWKGGDPTRLDQAVAAAREKFPGLPVEVEVETFDELRSALLGRPEWIMLDNMPPAMMREAVAIVAGRCKLEASGGIDAATIRAVAETGVDAISLGCLTHSVKAADLSLEIAI
ncbi:MAG: carboxylating nicotinate-nucleotide diphosphorylase [Kiritimatiellia bacterium]|jgi:nicotinate-nucleotide pyrophosphorylase (carboxylating)